MSDTEPQGDSDCTPHPQQENTSCITEDTQETASSSEKGVAAEANKASGSVATSSKKIPLCRFFKKAGKCRYGDGCKFAHELPGKAPRDEELGAETGHGAEGGEVQPETLPQEKSSGGGEQKVCRFYSRSGWCRNGKRCRFLHNRVKAEVSVHVPAEKDTSKQDEAVLESQDVGEDGSKDAAQEGMASNPTSKDGKEKKERPKKICRYFKAGHCSLGDRCKFLHPKMEASKLASSTQTKPRSNEARTAMTRPNPIQNEAVSMKIADLAEMDLKRLRETEITQLMKRFTKDQMTVIEKSDGETLYRVTVNPTDPDWPYDIQDFEFEVMFPASYPLEPFTISMPEDQVLPNTVLQYMNENIGEWILAKHGTNQISGKVELMFRPFLRWLDRSLERLFTDGAKQFKKVVDAKTAGFEFVAYSKQKQDENQDIVQDTDIQQPADPPTDPEGVVIIQGTSTCDPDTATDADTPSPDTRFADTDAGDTPSEETINTKVDLSNVQRRGTEIKLSELQLSESISTLVAQTIAVIIQCSRCKNKCDIITPARRINVAQCGKCQHRQVVNFRPSLVHHFTATLGFLDLEGCTTFDLLLADCVFVIGCLDCSEETKVQGLQFGQIRNLWCDKCHAKMTIQLETAKFHQLQASQALAGDKAHVIQVKQQRKQVHPDIHEGHPLPHHGTCKHFKKSFRWLRFPCCGKCYPCDHCHDEEEVDHEMKYANRMICGFCCKEQQYSPDKPCISCESLTTKSKTSHWEGGTGCRNKDKMSKSDKQKYANTNKTVSRKQQNLHPSKSDKNDK